MIRARTIAVILLAAGLYGACSSSSEQGSSNSSNSSGSSGSSGGEQSSRQPTGIEAPTNDAGPPPEAPPLTPPTSLATVVDSGVPVVDAGPPPTTGPGNLPAPPPRPEMSSQAREYYRQGISAATQNQLDASRQAFESALSADNRAYLAAYNAGVVAERQGQDGQADGFYQRALAIQPDFELALVARTRLLMRQRRMNEALSLAAGISRSYPGNTTVRGEYARLLVLANRPAEAIEEARRVLRADERNVVAKLAVAEAYRAQGHGDLSLYIVNDLINGSDPNHPNNGPGANNAQVHYLRGLLQIEVSRNIPDAIRSFERAVQLDPQFAEARNNLGVYYLQSGNYQQALEQLGAAALLSPSWGKAHLNLGDALRATGEYDRALAELQRAQQLDSSLVEVHYNVGRLYSEQSRSIPNQGAENLQRKLQLMQQALAAFTRFRDSLGGNYATHPRHDDTEAQLTRLPQQIERTQRSLQRAQRTQQRTTPTPAPAPSSGDDAGAGSSGTAPSGGSSAPSSTEGGQNTSAPANNAPAQGGDAGA